MLSGGHFNRAALSGISSIYDVGMEGGVGRGELFFYMHKNFENHLWDKR